MAVLADPVDVAGVERRSSPVERWFMQPGSALVLALLRIAVFGGLLYTGLRFDPRDYARLPKALILGPQWGGWLLAELPINPTVAGLTWVVMMGAAVLAVVGWRVRLSGAVAVTAAVYVIGLTAIFGKVDHHHHMLWIGALLAVSPCADRLTPWAKSKPAPSAVYGFPLRVTWLLIGIVYLGAGLPKFTSAGLDWALSDNLRNHMWIHWHVNAMDPIFRMDRRPWLYQAAGLLTLVFELGFVVAVLWRRSRTVAAAVGLGFHIATKMMLGIFFQTLVACYVAFLPSWSTMRADERAPRPVTVVVAFGLLASTLAAALLTVTNGWPIASYPVFYPTGPEVTEYVVTDGSGDAVTADDVELRPKAWRFLVQRVGREPGLAPVLAEHLGIDGILLERLTVHADPDDMRVVRVELLYGTGGADQPRP